VAVAHQAGGLLHGLRIDHGQAAPGEGLLVHRHGGAVEFDGAHQRVERQRHQALLPGVAEDEQVGGDGIAQQRGGQLGGIEQQRLLAAQATRTPAMMSAAGNCMSGRVVNVPGIAS
jgi:hypothetical protein